MGMLYDVYCDESCHLVNGRDRDYAMAIGGIWCPDEKKKQVFDRIREIKAEHGVAVDTEIKWNKVSPVKLAYYLDLVNYFFDNSDLHFLMTRTRYLSKREMNNHALADAEACA